MTGKFKYATKMDSGYSMTMTGSVFGPPHHVVITAALDHQLSDNVILLDAAPEMLALLKEAAESLPYAPHTGSLVAQIEEIITRVGAQP